jgi:hypothetical protein
MTGDGNGLPGLNPIGNAMWYEGVEYSLTEGRAVDNIPFVEFNPDFVWRVPAEQLGDRLDYVPDFWEEATSTSSERRVVASATPMTIGIQATFNPFNPFSLFNRSAVPAIPYFHDMRTFYPQLAWIDIGPYADAIVAFLEDPTDPGGGGDGENGGGDNGGDGGWGVPDTFARFVVTGATVSLIVLAVAIGIVLGIRRFVWGRKEETEIG